MVKSAKSQDGQNTLLLEDTLERMVCMLEATTEAKNRR